MKITSIEPLYFKPQQLYGDGYRRFGFKIVFPNGEHAELFPNPIQTYPKEIVEQKAMEYLESITIYARVYA